MTTDSTQTVREIAIQYPATVPVFESLGIDYCCGGKRTLAEACQRANVPLAQAMAIIAGLEDREVHADGKWLDRPMSELTGHIVSRHHEYVRTEAPRLRAMIDKVINRHGDAHPELEEIRAAFATLADELAVHMTKEERILFPFIEQMEALRAIPAACFGSVEMPISNMLADHDEAGVLLERIRALANAFVAPDNACPTYRGLYHGLHEFERDLHLHVHLENNILFPRAVELEKQLTLLRQDAQKSCV